MESKFVQLVGESYKVVRGFVAPEECDSYVETFRQACVGDSLEYDSTLIAGVCMGLHQHPPAQLFLVNKNVEVSKLLGADVLPTYTYTRSYGPKGYLEPHTDRDACEISVTVHLDGDEQWDFEIINVSGETDVITLEKGDAILFDGVNFLHNRIDEYVGDEYTQLFLHYVFAEGDHVKETFDYKNQSTIWGQRDSYIKVFDNWLSESECDGIVNASIAIDDWAPAGTSGEEVPGEMGYRVCDTICTTGHKELDQLLFTYVTKVISYYCQQYVHLTISTDEGYNILRYQPGGKYDIHIDQGPKHNRALTIIFNLNDDYEGGDLEFFNGKHVIKPKKGDVIIFPSSFMFDHAIAPITEGVRYSMVTWGI